MPGNGIESCLALQAAVAPRQFDGGLRSGLQGGQLTPVCGGGQSPRFGEREANLALTDSRLCQPI
ncbi:MAG: hypothetical protein ACKOJF_20710, partial [Planctomycetaceae bacterium]